MFPILLAMTLCKEASTLLDHLHSPMTDLFPSPQSKQSITKSLKHRHVMTAEGKHRGRVVVAFGRSCNSPEALLRLGCRTQETTWVVQIAQSLHRKMQGNQILARGCQVVSDLEVWRFLSIADDIEANEVQQPTAKDAIRSGENLCTWSV